MKRIILTNGIVFIFLSILMLLMTSCQSDNINTNNNEHFDSEGHYKQQKNAKSFVIKKPQKINFYVEVSGSMNGFFRANKPTDFKADLWKIISYYSSIAPEICVLTNDGNVGDNFGQSEFQTKMNTGAFVSSASTKMPIMVQTIIDSLDTESGEVAVLVSDMKYSPVGAAAPEVLRTQYSTDISKIIGKYGKAVSLICATSNYLDKSGNEVCSTSPYYYFIIGNQEQVAEVRNGISALLKMAKHFIDNIESGFDYGHAVHSFGTPNRCQKLDNEPTFLEYEEEEDGDTCTIMLKVNLENYRWLMSDKLYFSKAFKASAKYGSEIKIGNIQIKEQPITVSTKELKRTATATVELKVFNMATDSEVIEWNLELPDTDYTLFNQFFDGATNENDPSKSYTVIDFVKGMFQGSVVTKNLSPNYILISKKG
ncbi:MAG: hypothetical protein MJZ42_02815 [Bacteroidales bacterium]|nr:hypothetical protein [Bacteroidales bacterium]